MDRVWNLAKNQSFKRIGIYFRGYNDVNKAFKKYISVLRVQWKEDNKPNGLEVQEVRIGGLIERLLGCNQVLKEYLQGKVSEIPELEIELLHEVLASASNTRMQYDGYVLSATVNRI